MLSHCRPCGLRSIDSKPFQAMKFDTMPIDQFDRVIDKWFCHCRTASRHVNASTVSQKGISDVATMPSATNRTERSAEQLLKTNNDCRLDGIDYAASVACSELVPDSVCGRNNRNIDNQSESSIERNRTRFQNGSGWEEVTGHGLPHQIPPLRFSRTT